VRHQGAQNGTTLHQYSQIPAAAVFYPVFYPKRQRGDFEMGYLLVTAANWKDRPERATSLPSWSYGFDPVARSLVSDLGVSRLGWSLDGSVAIDSTRYPAYSPLPKPDD